MFYALVHYPDIDSSRINQLRSKYDTQAGMIEPHITLVFPLQAPVDEQELASHIDGVLSNWRPFSIRLKGLLQSWDSYLFLSVVDGRENIIRLHKQLYVGLLAPHRRDDIPFIPHVTLGLLKNAADRCAQVLMEAERLGLDYRSSVKMFHLVKINHESSRIVQSKEFRLGE